jgi:hypothetical protein
MCHDRGTTVATRPLRAALLASAVTIAAPAFADTPGADDPGEAAQYHKAPVHRHHF